MLDIIARDTALRESAVMKIGVGYMLHRGVRRPILGTARDGYGAPAMLDGCVMIPTAAILGTLGIDIPEGAKTVTLTDKRGREYTCVSVDTVENAYGLKVSYDDMGLIAVGAVGGLLDRAWGLGYMMELMKGFVYEYASAAEVYEDCKANTNGFEHPYLFANKSTFDRLHRAYVAKEGDPDYDARLKGYLEYILNRSERLYRDLALPVKDDDYSVYVGIKPEKIPVNTNENPDGYDFGGRLGVPTAVLWDMAFNFMVSRDEKFLKLSYDYSVMLGEWTHWGPAHFLNCADASRPYAIALDWLYNDYVARGYDVGRLERILFDKGVEQGYLASLERECPYPNDRVIGGFVYHKKINNWNAVCTSGMTIAALCIMGKPEYSLPSAALVSDGISYLAKYGLSQYAPDGSYIESPAYWTYGTNTLFAMIGALISACGRDYGYMSTWGLDSTCDFAVNAESSDFRAWSYHDGGTGSISTEWFNFFAFASGRRELAALRAKQLEGGKNPTLWDAVYYDADIPEECEVPLQYAMKGIQSFVARSSWDKGATFVGLHGDSNSASHGQLDAGCFVYHDNSVIWFTDTGADNYNVYSYWGNIAGYYRRCCEGNNTLCLTDNDRLPSGQLHKGTAILKRCGTYEDGAFAIVDSTTAYADEALKCERGIKLTADRRLTVIKDEAEFATEQNGCWIAHYDLNEVGSVEIGNDGRTAILTAAKDESKKLRVDILTDDSELKFEILDCYTYLLTTTHPKGWSEERGGKPEYPRDHLRRLIIRFKNRSTLDLAVGIQRVTEGTEPITYTPDRLENW